jgi:GTP:adenosylcobinamide-phosphate guanylyltransferase
MRAVITAGGTLEGAFAHAAGTRVKALAPFGARTLLDVALDACAQSGIDGVAVVGGPEVRAHLRGTGVGVIDAVEDGGTNVLRALDAWRGERFAYLTSDLPFADGAGLRDLIGRSAPFAMTMGLTAVGAFDARFPGAPPSGVTLRGERVVNACAFVLAPEALEPVRSLATRFFDARKSLFALARLLGPGLCLRFLTKRLGVDDVEAYARRVLRVSVGAVRDTDPGLCYDVDTLEEYRYACARLD